MPKLRKKEKVEGPRKGSGRRWPQSTLDPQDVITLNRRFPGFSFRVPTAEETPSTWVKDELCIFIEFFKDGTILPLPEFLVEFCNMFQLVPAMLMRNTLIILRGLHGFFSAWKVPWTKESIMSLITFTLKEPGSFYAQPKHSAEFKMVGIPSSRHGWKEKYAFVTCLKGWPISTIPTIPHKDAYKGWGTTKKISRMLLAHGAKPFCINVETLEIIPASEKEIRRAEEAAAKRKTAKTATKPAKKSKAIADSEPEAATGETEEDEESEEGSEETSVAAKVTRKVVEKYKRPAGIVIKEPTTTTAAKVEEPAGKGKEKAEETQAKDSSSDDTAHFAGGFSIPEEGEKADTGSEWEWHYSKEDEMLSMKKNLKYRFVPELTPSPLPLLLPELFQHPEDTKFLEGKNDFQLGELQSHLLASNMIISNCLTGRLMMMTHELGDTRELLACQKELARRFELESQSLGSIGQSQDAEYKADVEELKAKAANATESLHNSMAEVVKLQYAKREVEAKLEAERAAAYSEKNALKAKIAELEGAMARMTVGQTQEVAKDKWIEEYKASDDYQSELKAVSTYGFDLLRRVLKKEGEMPAAKLDMYDYDSCVLEDADGNIPF